MGDDVDWLPNTVEEALQCLLLITLSNNNQPDEDSKALAKDYLESFKPKKKDNLFDSIILNIAYRRHKAMAEYLIPKPFHKRLEIPSSNFSWLLVPIIESPINFLSDRLAPIIPGGLKRAEKRGADQQSKIIKRIRGVKKASYVPKEKTA